MKERRNEGMCDDVRRAQRTQFDEECARLKKQGEEDRVRRLRIVVV